MKVDKILHFLGELKNNNHKAWLDDNRKLYEEAKKDFEKIIQFLITEIGSFDADIANLEPKSCIFRLNRDVRFSKDKSPYKTNFGASLQKGGKKTGLGGYYLHLQPENESFVGGGVYMPMPENLAKIRQEIDFNAQEFHQIVDNEDFKNCFGEIWGEKLKTMPKGYPKDHPEIEYLKLKSFISFKSLKDEEVQADDFLHQVILTCKTMKPFNDFLNRAIEE